MVSDLLYLPGKEDNPLVGTGLPTGRGLDVGVVVSQSLVGIVVATTWQLRAFRVTALTDSPTSQSGDLVVLLVLAH